MRMAAELAIRRGNRRQLKRIDEYPSAELCGIGPLGGGGTAGERMRGDSVNPLLERITIDPRICGGKPCITGTRIWVSLILDFLADDMTEVELLDQYPGLTHEDVLAAIAYGAEAARHSRLCRKPGVKFKLDENMSRGAADLIRVAGHDIVTVASQGCEARRTRQREIG